MDDSPLWLIRTSRLEILGPMTHAALIEKIQLGELSLEDEVCKSSGSWFYLSEIGEVRNQLGMNLPDFMNSAEEKDRTLVEAVPLDGNPDEPNWESFRRKIERPLYFKILVFLLSVIVAFLGLTVLSLLKSVAL